jgi:cytochrome b pre-mRNA-processing protein 3
MGLLDRLRAAARPPAPRADTLYRAVVAEARRPDWYLAGEAPDTLDGRFDMVALVLSLVMLRLERDGNAGVLNAALAERFVEDMDGSLRQMGIGDQNVGKEIGRMMSALGGRLGAYRDAAAADTDAAWANALARNLWRGAAASDGAVAWVTARVRRLAAAIAAPPLDRLEAQGWEALA